ncbi:hypothetical protein VUR80DRAFT_5486 [Thermomyces stellatus]
MRRFDIYYASSLNYIVVSRHAAFVLRSPARPLATARGSSTDPHDCFSSAPSSRTHEPEAGPQCVPAARSPLESSVMLATLAVHAECMSDWQGSRALGMADTDQHTRGGRHCGLGTPKHEVRTRKLLAHGGHGSESPLRSQLGTVPEKESTVSTGVIFEFRCLCTGTSGHYDPLRRGSLRSIRPNFRLRISRGDKHMEEANLGIKH